MSGGAPADEWIAAVVDALRAAGDPGRAVEQQRYMKSVLPYHGVSTPELRALLRPLLADARQRLPDRATWESTVRAMWDGATHREQRYAAISLCRARFATAWQDIDTLGLYEHLVRSGAWWDLVDEIAAHLVGPIVRTDRHSGRKRMLAWADDPHLWVRRTAILHQLRFKADTDTDMLTAVIDLNLPGSLHGDEFFVRKAIGWALREFSYIDGEWVRRFVAARAGRLSTLSKREGLKRLSR